MNEELIKTNDLKQKVLDQIQKGQVKMRPRVFFLFQVIALSFLVILIFLISVLLVSYMLFLVKTNGSLLLLGFGKRGLYEFFLVFPWLILIVDILLLFFLDFLLKKFKFGYHSPIIYLFLGTMVVIVVSGSLPTFSSVHGNFMRKAEHQNLPIAGSFYQDIRFSHQEKGIFRGEVISLQNNSFIIKSRTHDLDQKEVLVKVIFPLNISTTSLVSIGEEVFVAGDLVDGEIRAYGIGKLPKND